MTSFTTKPRLVAAEPNQRPALHPDTVHRQPAFRHKHSVELDRSNTSCRLQERCMVCRRRVALLSPASEFPRPTVQQSCLGGLRLRRSVEVHGECPEHRPQRSASPDNTRRTCRIRIVPFIGNVTTRRTAARIDNDGRCSSVSCALEKGLRYAAICGSVFSLSMWKAKPES